MVWVVLDGFSRYRISDIGDVYDCLRSCVVKQQINKDGYCCTTLRHDDGSRKTFKVHRLVAICHVPGSGEQVNHIDGCKSNNCAHNLEWCSHAENIKHAWDNGLLKSTDGRSAKLSAAHRGKKMGSENPRARKVMLVNSGQVFGSISDACRETGACSAGVSKCCTGSQLSAGKDSDGNPLRWKYC